MDNANSREYLDKIKAAVFENLRHTIPAPSVQMTDVPPSFGAMTDEEEAELDDLDADANQDARVTQHSADKHTSNDNEYEDSGDEEMGGGIPRPRVGIASGLVFTDSNGDEAPESGTNTPADAGTPAQSGSPGPRSKTPEEDPDVTIEDADAAAAAAASTGDKTSVTEVGGEPGKSDKSDAAASEAESRPKSREPETEPEAQPVQAQPEAQEAAKEDKAPEAAPETAPEASEKEPEKEPRVDPDGDVDMGETPVKEEEDKR
ncbi:MAG: hypothetical protein IMZ46_11765 [Acidobacteria bacterium]|nr:hypothetical protein [Acidobacteriota bacterium]